MVDTARLRQTFLDLLAIDSPPGEERAVSRYCADVLRDCGFLCQTDAAGNLIAQQAGTAPGPRIFFSAHTDTVQPTAGLIVREEDGYFRTSGLTILGADDKAGVAEILEGMRVLDERGLPHPDLQVVLSTREEVGLQGARELAVEVVAGSIGFVFDSSGVTGQITTAAPTHDLFEVRIHGRAAHAGLAPENGVSALRIAARAIERMPLGRIDPETTANVGTLRGGTANNIVAEEAYMTLEARSRSREKLEEQVRQMRAAIEEAAELYGGEVEIRHEREYEGYVISRDDLPLRIAAEAWRRVSGAEPNLRVTGGGSDANVFNSRGVKSVVVSCGYIDAHTTDERIRLEDLVKGAQWAVEIACVAAEA